MPFLAIILLAGALGGVLGWRRAVTLEKRLKNPMHSRPGHHAAAMALSVILPMLAVLAAGSFAAHYHISNALHAQVTVLPGGKKDLALWEGPLYACVTQPEEFSCPANILPLVPWLAENLRLADRILVGTLLLIAVLGGAWGWRRIGPQVQARQAVERVGRLAFAACALVSVLVTLGILGSVSFEAWRFFQKVPATDFLFGLHWSPQIALRADQAGASGSFGMIPLFTGTLLITLIAMVIAVPVGVLSAVYLVEYANHHFRDIAKPVLEMLAGVPTVVYGYFAVITVAPLLKGAGAALGLDVASTHFHALGRYCLRETGTNGIPSEEMVELLQRWCER
ncbi:MAG: phosphate ABC transporter permease family protein, partial [Alphaproteobacteria bacterium]|nr:phosphate ABC transporter permease family protein [Alphaproteobacteria bacterium]